MTSVALNDDELDTDPASLAGKDRPRRVSYLSARPLPIGLPNAGRRLTFDKLIDAILRRRLVATTT